MIVKASEVRSLGNPKGRYCKAWLNGKVRDRVLSAMKKAVIAKSIIVQSARIAGEGGLGQLRNSLTLPLRKSLTNPVSNFIVHCWNPLNPLKSLMQVSLSRTKVHWTNPKVR